MNIYHNATSKKLQLLVKNVKVIKFIIRVYGNRSKCNHFFSRLMKQFTFNQDATIIYDCIVFLMNI